MATGFYEVSKDFRDIPVNIENRDSELFLKFPIVLGMEEVLNVRCGKIDTDNKYSLTLKLSDKGTQTLNNFSQEYLPTRIALVLDNRIIHSMRLLVEVAG